MAPASGWLFKTEPGTYSYEDLEASGGTTWDGVANNQALSYLKQVRQGDRVFIYHTGAEKSVVGLARVTRDAYPDPKARGETRLVVVDLEPQGRLARPVTLSSLKGRADLADFPLVRLPRLSVMPVTPEQWKVILEMAGT